MPSVLLFDHEHIQNVSRTLGGHVWRDLHAFKDFHKSLKPGEKACCNWRTHDGNTEGKKYAKVKLAAWYFLPMAKNAVRDGNVDICTGFETKANGMLVIHGSVAKLLSDGEGLTCKTE